MSISAGLLPFRRTPMLEVLIAHPGGPLFARKDAGAWSVVKGQVDPGEEARVAAAREFLEETGWKAPVDAWLELGSVRLRSGKLVYAWGVEADFEPTKLEPGPFTMFWHGRHQTFPEIDRVAWCQPEEARRLLNPAQIPFLDRLAAKLGD